MAEATPEEDTAIPLPCQDRALPGWVQIFSWVLGTLASVLWLSLALVALLFQSFVLDMQDASLLPILALAGLVPALAATILELTQDRAMAGFLGGTTRVQNTVRAAMGVLVFLTLEFVHPLLGLGLLGAVALRAGLILAVFRATIASARWDFNPAEAVSILAGRDRRGFELAQATPALPVSGQAALGNLTNAVGFLATLLISGVLAMRGVMEPVAMTASLLLVLSSSEMIGRFLQDTLDRRDGARPDARVRESGLVDADERGLEISDLNVMRRGGQTILGPINLSLEPGTMTGIIGGAGAGKSLLLDAIVAPHDLTGMSVEGGVRFDGRSLWRRSSAPAALPVAHVPPRPLGFAASGMNNITCFQRVGQADRAVRILEQMLFSRETAEMILAAPDMRDLPTSWQKALGLARAFLMNPALYLFDRPEDGANEAMIAALCQRIQIERRAGRSFVVATDNRALLEMCDTLIVLEEGRLIDSGPADDIRARRLSGWSRLVSERTLEAEDALQSWIRSHFRRSGDEKNRRNVINIAGEMLALSCQDITGSEAQTLTFDFKNQKGHCVLRMRDRGAAIGSTQMARARQDAENLALGRPRSALAQIIRGSQHFDHDLQNGERVITVKIATYDPRLAPRNAVQDAR